MSKLTKKNVFFRIKMERVSVFFLFLFSTFLVFFRNKMERVSVFFLLSFFYISYLSILSFFCLLLYFLLHFVICILRKSVSPFLCLSTFQVINMSFLNKMWYKGLIQRILGCGDLFIFSEKAKDLVM